MSIITPSFRQGTLLEDALRSVLVQNDPAIEHWVLDGGSTDGTVPLLQDYAARNPGRIFWISEKDSGQSDAINKGLRRATGDIVGWLNADDLYFPGALPHVAEIFQARADVDVVYGKGVFLNRAGEYLCDFPHQAPFDAQKLLAGHAFLLQPTVFWRRAVTDRIGLLDPSLHFSMDFDLWCRMARAGCRFHYQADRFIAAARYYPDTKTLSGNWRRFRELQTVARRHSRRAVPAITFFSFLDALMSTAPAPVRRPLRWLYRQRKRWSDGDALNYGELRPRYARGPRTVHFPWYGEASELMLTLEVKDTPSPMQPDRFLMIHAHGRLTGEFPLAGKRTALRLPWTPDNHEIQFTLTTRPADLHFRLSSLRVPGAASAETA